MLNQDQLLGWWLLHCFPATKPQTPYPKILLSANSEKIITITSTLNIANSRKQHLNSFIYKSIQYGIQNFVSVATQRKTLTFLGVFVINCTVQPESVPGYCLLISHLSDFFVPRNVSHDVVNGPKKKERKKIQYDREIG